MSLEEQNIPLSGDNVEVETTTGEGTDKDEPIIKPTGEERENDMAALARAFFEGQNEAILEMKRQQENFLKRFAVSPQTSGFVPPRKRRRIDDEDLTQNVYQSHDDEHDGLSLHPDPEDALDLVESDDDDHDEGNLGNHRDLSDMSDPNALANKSATLEQDSQNVLSEQEMEGLMTSKYKSMLDQVEEELGKPLSVSLATACKRTWNLAKLDAKKKEKLLKDVKIPSNMKRMKTSKLNSEIYIRMRDNGRDKDEAAANRQREVTRAAIPLLQAIDKVNELQATFLERAKRDQEKKPLTTFEKSAYNKLNEIHELGQKSYSVLNYFITDNTRKRKFSACANLGKNFTSFASIKEDDSGENDFLFGEEVMKKMKSDLKKLPVKPSSSKNVNNFGKSPRSYSSGNNYNNNYNNGYSTNNKNQFQSHKPRQSFRKPQNNNGYSNHQYNNSKKRKNH